MRPVALRQKLLSIAERVRDDLLEAYREKITSVVLYGSVARGDCHESSNINLLIIFTDLVASRRERYEMIEKELRSVKRDLQVLYSEDGILTDVIVFVKVTSEIDIFAPFYMDLAEDAILLYDKDWWFTIKLAKLRNYLKTSGAKRVWKGRMWYWLSPHVKKYSFESLSQAKYHLFQAKQALKDSFWNVAVREALESLTFSIRAIMRGMGVEIPSRTAPSNFFTVISASLPGEVKSKISSAITVFQGLKNEWDLSFYSDETSPEKEVLFTEKDAVSAVNDAEKVFEQARTFAKENVLT